MFTSFQRAVAQLPDPRLRRLIGLAMGGAVLLLLLIYSGLGWAGARLQLSSIGWLDLAGHWLGGVGLTFATLMLFPPVVILLVSACSDAVAAAVEARYYPHLAPPRPAGWLEVLRNGLQLAGLALFLNLLALPLYGALLLLFGLGGGVFLAVNGYLLARDLGVSLAERRLSSAEARRLFRAHRGRLWLGGAGLVLLSTLPLINLAVPVLAVAYFTHEIEALRGRG